MGEAICQVMGGSGCSGLNLTEGVCRAAGKYGCTNKMLPESLCEAAGGTNCKGIFLSEILGASIEACGANILYMVFVDH